MFTPIALNNKMIRFLIASLILLTSLAFIVIFRSVAKAAPSDDFVTTWKTDNPGTSSSSSITILSSIETYNYNVDWNNDGTFDEFGITGGITHDFGTPGTYTIRISGTFPRLSTCYTTGDQEKLIAVNQWGSISWQSMQCAFQYAKNLQILAPDTPNLSAVTDMSLMFDGASNFNSPINNWNVSNVTNMGAMFRDAENFNQPLNNWNTSNVTNMSNTFNGALSFNQPLNNWNTGNVITMGAMFQYAMLFNQDLNNWDVSNVTEMDYMFTGASAFNGNISSWNTSSLTSAYAMFWLAESFNQPIGNWDISGLTSIALMFGGATDFNQPLNNWNTSNVTNMSNTFSGASSFNQSLNNWDTSNVTTMWQMFKSASIFNGDITTWDTGSVTTMGRMLDDARDFNQPIGNWDTSQVTDMNHMFYAAYEFNQPLNNWDTSQVTDMSAMFTSAYHFNQPIGNWNTSKVANMTNMFQGATSFNQSLNNWDTSQVTDMNAMFSYALAFNQNINAWNTSNVTKMEFMFTAATEYNQPLDNWDTSQVTDMNHMFFNASNFNQPLNNWDTSLVTDMSSMFTGAHVFNQPLNNWDISNVQSINDIFSNAQAFNQDISSWDTSNITNMSGMFFNAYSFDQNLGSWNITGVTDMSNMFDYVTLSTQNYDGILTGWNNQNAQYGVVFSAGNSKYCAAGDRSLIIGNDGWTITDGGYDVCQPPSVQTGAVNSITSTSANAIATVTDSGGGLDEVGIEYGQTVGYGTSATANTPDVGDNVVGLNGLQCETTYHYRAYATNSKGTDYGIDNTFTTAECPSLPTVQTGDYTVLSDSSVRINSIVLNDGNDSLTWVGVNYGIEGNSNTEYGGPGVVGDNQITLSGLYCGIEYFYRSGAENSVGRTYGQYRTFTLPCPEPADLAISGYRSTPAPITAGMTFSYNVTMSNLGPNTYDAGTSFYGYFNVPNDVTLNSFTTDSQNTDLQCQFLGSTLQIGPPFDSYGGNIILCLATLAGDFNANQNINVSLNLATTRDLIQGQDFLRGLILNPESNLDPDLFTILEAVFGGGLVFDLDVNNVINLTYGINDEQQANGDGDSIPDAIENAAPNNGDANNDGTLDALQTHVTSFVNPATKNYVTLVAPNGLTISTATALTAAQAALSDGLEYPLGFTAFTITGLDIGQTIPFTMYTYTNRYTAGDVTARKYLANKAVFNIDDVVLSNQTIGGQKAIKASYSLTDGGELDQDNRGNGSIVDPIGLAKTSGLLANTGIVTVFGMITGLIMITGALYTFRDYRKHKAPLEAIDPKLAQSYTYWHHLRIVTIPLVRYRLRIVVEEKQSQTSLPLS